jgi:hypothetical protein
MVPPPLFESVSVPLLVWLLCPACHSAPLAAIRSTDPGRDSPGKGNLVGPAAPLKRSTTAPEPEPKSTSPVKRTVIFVAGGRGVWLVAWQPAVEFWLPAANVEVIAPESVKAPVGVREGVAVDAHPATRRDTPSSTSGGRRRISQVSHRCTPPIYAGR